MRRQSGEAASDQSRAPGAHPESLVDDDLRGQGRRRVGPVQEGHRVVDEYRRQGVLLCAREEGPPPPFVREPRGELQVPRRGPRPSRRETIDDLGA